MLRRRRLSTTPCAAAIGAFALLSTAAAGTARAEETATSGQQYIDLCRDRGVPIPPAWGVFGSGGWNLLANPSGPDYIDDVTPDPDSEGYPYLYTSSDPEGHCMALPRVDPVTKKALLTS